MDQVISMVGGERYYVSGIRGGSLAAQPVGEKQKYDLIFSIIQFETAKNKWGGISGDCP